MRHWLTFGLSLALSAIILYYVFQRVDGRLLRQLLKTQSRSLLTAAAFFIFLQIILGGERWRAILSALTRERHLPALSIQAVYYASIFFNCLPFGTLGGDVARVLLARRFTVSVKQLVLSVLIDRIVMVVALILLCVVTLPAIAHPLARDAWFGCIAALVVGMTGFVLLEPIERILGRWRRWNLVQMVLHAAAELRYLGRGRGLLGTSVRHAVRRFGGACRLLHCTESQHRHRPCSHYCRHVPDVICGCAADFRRWMGGP